jgi:hypothetical protein
MIKTTIIAAILTMIPSVVFSAEVVAKAGTWGWKLAVISDGDPWESSCKLRLVADTYQLKHEVSIKRKGVNCALFGPVHLYAAETPDHNSVTIFFEAARGGDGDHSGPIVEAFKLTKKGLKKLGEHELFDATYNRKDEQITSVTGTVLYSLCDICDGPDASDPADNFYIPAKITTGQTGISVKPTITKQERKALLDKFDSQAKIDSKEKEHDKDFENYIKVVRKELASFLGR